jgi:hypothetical protein
MDITADCFVQAEGLTRAALAAQVHVTVDTAMQSGELTVAAFVARTLALGERALAKEFQAVPCAVRTVEVEKLGGAASRLPVDTPAAQAVRCW